MSRFAHVIYKPKNIRKRRSEQKIVGHFARHGSNKQANHNKGSDNIGASIWCILYKYQIKQVKQKLKRNEC